MSLSLLFTVQPNEGSGAAKKRKFQKLNLDFLKLNFDSSASNLKPDFLTENSKGKITKHLNSFEKFTRRQNFEISKISTMFGFWKLECPTKFQDQNFEKSS